mgnify:FL=1
MPMEGHDPFDRPADRLHQQGLRDPRHPFQKQMPAGEKGDQDPFDDDLLSDHRLPDTGSNGLCKGRSDTERRGSGGLFAIGHVLVESRGELNDGRTNEDDSTAVQENS